MTFTPIQKRAIMHLAVDLAKADRQIHAGEVSLLNDFQKKLGMKDDELEMIHYMSFQECIAVLDGLEDHVKEGVIQMFESIIEADVDVDVRERILLSAIRMALSENSRQWTRILSVSGVETDCSSSQIIYLEKRRCDSSRKILDDDFNNLLLAKALNDVGLQLFYLPRVKKVIDVGLLCKSMDYILPTGSRCSVADLDSVDSMSLFGAFCSTYRLSPGSVGFDAFLMLKLQEGEVLNDEGALTRSMDFICMDVSSGLKDRVAHFVNLLDAPGERLSYDGYYRLLYDHLMSASSVASRIFIDGQFGFYLTDAGNQKLCFESAPQAKTLYLLLLRYGVSGVSQECFDEALKYLDASKEVFGETAWNYLAFMNRLAATGTRATRLIADIMKIYAQVSTKDPEKEGFLNYIYTIIKQRSALKNYISGGFSSVIHLLDKDKYCVSFNNDTRSYQLSVDVSLIYIEENGRVVCLTESDFWNRLSV